MQGDLTELPLVTLDFANKPPLQPGQLRQLREHLQLTLADMCSLLQVGANSYGRWERGESPLTPAMNLLIHCLLDRLPAVKSKIVPRNGVK